MKHIKEFNKFISEAARVGNSSWQAVLSDLGRQGWDIKGNLAIKFYDEDDEERKLELDNSGDDVYWTIYDGKGKELNSGSFDAEGLSAGELDGEVWNYIEESKISEAIDIKYWVDYNTNASGQGKKEHEVNSKNFEDTFEDALVYWNQEADGAENRIKGAQIQKIRKIAQEFFKKAGWISINVIQAMIAQETYQKKHFQTYESFKKTYGQKISPADFKKISTGKNVHYMGTPYKVVSNDGYILTLKNEDGDAVEVNLGQFNHGGQINEAASVPSNIMDFAKRKGSYAVNLVKKAAAWADKAGKYISGGTAIGKNYDTIILDIKYHGSEIYINLNDETIELYGEEVTDAKSFKRVLDENE